MKKVLAVVMALVLVLSMTACGSKADIDGSWKLVSMTINDKDAFEGIDLNALAQKGYYLGATCKDGKGNLTFGDESIEFTYDDKKFEMKNDDGTTDYMDYSRNGDNLSLTKVQDDGKMVVALKKMTDDEAKKFASQTEEDLEKAILQMVLESYGLSADD
ncbi:MAG: hypothetical protein K6E47_13815 [Lachnospiraceae bacterium]|nr:hypothetical protein [Lachnospiraceae bacterium]